VIKKIAKIKKKYIITHDQISVDHIRKFLTDHKTNNKNNKKKNP